jgi:hypothetical protein
VALVAYQSGLTERVTAQEPPEEVTGAAGVLDGGRAGGVSWCDDRVLAPLGWLAALLAGLVAGLTGLAAGAEAAGLTVLAYPGMACAKTAASPAVAAAAPAVIANVSDLMRLTVRWR